MIDARSDSEQAVNEISQQLLGIAPESLSEELREFIQKVVGLHPQVDGATNWLQANNNALDGESPVDLIRAGQVQRLNEFWDRWERVYPTK